MQGGVEKHCQELYSRLSRYNFDITVLGRKCYIKDHTYEYNGVKIIPIRAPRIKSIEAIYHTTVGLLYLFKNRKDYDILHIHAIGPSLLVYPARKMGFPVVVTNHGPEYERQKWGSIAKIVLKLGERLGSKYAYLIIAVSKHIQNLLFRQYGAVAVYIPNGVSIPDREFPGETLSRFGIEPGRYFLAVGRLVPEKGFHDLLKAYEKLETDFKLVIVGSADHKDKYSMGLTTRAKQSENVVMTGFQKGKALSELYSNAGLFVLPSYHEGLPIVALEAMSYNLPMLLSDIPANKEIAFPGETFPVGNVDALSKKLKKFIECPSSFSSSRIIMKKRKRLENEFNWDVIAEQTAELYLGIIKGIKNQGNS